MKNIIFKTEKIVVICLLFASSFLAAQTTYTVNNNPNTAADFTNLQTAINTVAAGSILYVQQSATSYGNIIVNKKITLVGRSHSDPSFKTQVGTVSFASGASDSTIKGLQIGDIVESDNGATLNNITILDNKFNSITIGSQHTFNNILLQGNILNGGVFIYSGASNILITNNLIFCSNLAFYKVDTLLISNNIFCYYPGQNIYNYSASDVLNISNCIFINNYNASTNVQLVPGTATIQINNCVTYNYDTTYTFGFNTGAGITISGNVKLNTNPLFTNVGLIAPGLASPYNTSVFAPATDDLTLQAGSPITDGGIFKDYNFKLYGTPTGYPTIKVVENSATVPKNGNLSVTIEAKTN